MSDLLNLKLKLFAHGIYVNDDAKRKIAMSDEICHYRNKVSLLDYVTTSGITLVFDGKVYVNARIIDRYAETPYFLSHNDDMGFFVGSRYRRNTYKTNILQVADYVNRNTSLGNPYINFGVTHADRVRISPIGGCSFSCGFCDLHNKYAYQEKNISELVETIEVALDDLSLPAKHILISGGTPALRSFEYMQNVYRTVLKRFKDVSVDIMMAPLHGLLNADELFDLDLNQFSINLEIWNDKIAERITPEKKELGKAVYLRKIHEIVRKFGIGSVRSMLIVGLEPAEDTLAGVQALLNIGCQPVLSPFVPDFSTVLKDLDPPSFTVMRDIFHEATLICKKYGIPLGPNCIPCQHNTMTVPKEIMNNDEQAA